MSDAAPEPNNGQPNRVRFIPARDFNIDAAGYEIGDPNNPETDIFSLQMDSHTVVYGTRWEMQALMHKGASLTDMLAQAAIADRVVMGLGPDWNKGQVSDIAKALKELTQSVNEMKVALEQARDIRNAEINVDVEFRDEAGKVDPRPDMTAELASGYDEKTNRMVTAAADDAIAMVEEHLEEILGTPLEEVLKQLKGTEAGKNIRYEGPRGNSWGTGHGGIRRDEEGPGKGLNG